MSNEDDDDTSSIDRHLDDADRYALAIECCELARNRMTIADTDGIDRNMDKNRERLRKIIARGRIMGIADQSPMRWNSLVFSHRCV